MLGCYGVRVLGVKITVITLLEVYILYYSISSVFRPKDLELGLELGLGLGLGLGMVGGQSLSILEAPNPVLNIFGRGQ